MSRIETGPVQFGRVEERKRIVALLRERAADAAKVERENECNPEEIGPPSEWLTYLADQLDRGELP